ncbi:GNAT family N-acetyltransferase [Streptomyces noursei]|uniref:GNAT family N-acetyltransferase n=1 Tax=Streptomyces noursei TaxID=1971 RepID=UPI00167A5ABF|nr:GNAT family N-acetyltransferase [Streptomyces noursei]MCZ1019712.1 GNAT family N-acetyltransferase [Streptomyces noursei]GGX51112.1 N-acetyltransferase [Streptomyces noursei]
MITPRAARPEDAAELVRLRRLMYLAMNGLDEPGSWERDAEAVARRQLVDPQARLIGFVLDGEPAGTGSGAAAPHLAACALGRIDERLPSPANPTGRVGFVFNVCTDPRYRGRGYARATTEALLAWFARHDIGRADLHATDAAAPLYRSLGFAEHATPLSLDLRRRPGTVAG